MMMVVIHNMARTAPEMIAGSGRERSSGFFHQASTTSGAIVSKVIAASASASGGRATSVRVN